MAKAILDTLAAIRTRRTIKLIAESPMPTKTMDADFIEMLMESAFFAPNHYPCSAVHQQHLPSPLPWRFYVLDSQNCRHLAKVLADNDIQMGKIMGLLNAADYLLQATWCPLPKHKDTPSHQLYDGSVVNMEHIAATSAAIQNVLLTATALGYENYWSSGGILREAFADKLLGIPEAEILLGSLFIFPSLTDISDEVECFTSKRRDQRGDVASSYRWVNVDPLRKV